MMEFMRSGDQSSLLLHFVDRYWSEVEGLNYVNTFQHMRESVDKMQACPARSPPVIGSPG